MPEQGNNITIIFDYQAVFSASSSTSLSNLRGYVANVPEIRSQGLEGDLGLVKLLAAMRGRRVEGWETAELLEPYGEWAGLASVYLLAGYAKDLLPVTRAA